MKTLNSLSVLMRGGEALFVGEAPSRTDSWLCERKEFNSSSVDLWNEEWFVAEATIGLDVRRGRYGCSGATCGHITFAKHSSRGEASASPVRVRQRAAIGG